MRNICKKAADCFGCGACACACTSGAVSMEPDREGVRIASLTEQWITMKDHLPALTGLFGTLACLLAFGPERFLIPAMLLITLVLTLLRGRTAAGKEAES